MAREKDVRYIRYYSEGNTARKLEPGPRRAPRKKVPKPRTRQRREILIRLDPLAVFGIVLAGVLLILMIVGAVRLSGVIREEKLLETYVEQLQTEKRLLNEEYRDGYDLDKIRETAKVYGMVPVDQVETHKIQVSVPQAEAPAPASFWERVCTFFEELFA